MLSVGMSCTRASMVPGSGVSIGMVQLSEVMFFVSVSKGGSDSIPFRPCASHSLSGESIIASSARRSLVPEKREILSHSSLVRTSRRFTEASQSEASSLVRLRRGGGRRAVGPVAAARWAAGAAGSERYGRAHRAATAAARTRRKNCSASSLSK